MWYIIRRISLFNLLCCICSCCGMEEASAHPSASLHLDLAGNPQAPPLANSLNSHQHSEADDQSQQRAVDQHHADADASLVSGELAQGKGDDLASSDAGKQAQHVDTAAPIDSVKGAVTKFGGILDWKERRKLVQVLEEAAGYQKRSQEAEAGKAQALQEVGATTTAIDELKLSLDKAQAEEAQARQDSELAELRLRETQQWQDQGASESAAAKAAELDDVRGRHATALADLQAARTELESVRKQHAAATAEADVMAARAREAAPSSQEADKAVEELAAELAALKKDLESSHAAHDEAEEKRLRLALALERDKAQWRREVEEAEQDEKKLEAEVMATKDVESEVAAASELLVSLRAELFARAVEGTLGGEEEKPAVSTQAMLDKTKKELEEAKASVEKAKEEAKCLRVAAASLRADLEKEKAELASLRRKEGASSASIPSLEEELRQVTSELAAAEARLPKDGSEASSMPAQVSEARREAERAKADARAAREEVARAREEAGVAKAALHAMELRLEAVVREILAANTSEEVATASADALRQESCNPPPQRKTAESQDDVEGGGVTLTAEEYEELRRRAPETEEAAGKRVTEAVKLIKEAKDAEVRSLEKLEKLARKTEQRRQALVAATEEADEAEFAKLAAERELRQWRAEHEHGHGRRAGGESAASPRAGLAEISVFDDAAGRASSNPHILSPRAYVSRAEMMGSSAPEAEAAQKKTFFPRMVMFLARKRAQSWKQ